MDDLDLDFDDEDIDMLVQQMKGMPFKYKVRQQECEIHMCEVHILRRSPTRTYIRKLRTQESP